MKQHTTIKKQGGSALFIMIMILVALSILTFMATNIGKTDASIGNAYTEQTRAFIQAEEMLARLRYALEQMPLPEGIQNENDSRITASRPIWLTKKLSTNYASKDGEPNFAAPQFAQDETGKPGWSDSDILTCQDISDWIVSKTNFNNLLPCNELDRDDRTRTVIELVSRKKSKGDIGDVGDTFFYRITIRAKGEGTGEVLAQGLTGIQYN